MCLLGPVYMDSLSKVDPVRRVDPARRVDPDRIDTPMLAEIAFI